MATSNIIRVVKTPATSVELAIKNFQNHNRARGLSPNTVSQYGYLLSSFVKHINDKPPIEITPDDIRDFIAGVLETKSATTASHCYICLNVFFTYLVQECFITSTPMTNIIKPKRRKTIIKTFKPESIEALLNNCDKSFIGTRDRTLIMLLIDTGLRATELCNINTSDIDWADCTIKVLGKGDKERVVPFGQATRKAINTYMAKRGLLQLDQLFITSLSEPYTRHALYQMIRKRCADIGIENVRCSPHTLRHTFAVSFLRNGADVFSLQKILGHADLTMTRHYAELSQNDVIEKHRLYSPADSLHPHQTGGRTRRK